MENQMVPAFEPQEIPGTDPEPVVSDVNTQEVVVPVATPVAPTVPGSKTPPNLLLQSLQEEREKRRIAEETLAALQNQPSFTPDQYSDEGRALKAEIDRLSSIISQGEAEKQQAALYAQYPQLKDKADEFAVFQAAKPGYTQEDVAKLFLAEQGLITPARKGLERGGTQRGTPSTGEMTPEDTERIRVNQPKLYLQMIQNGKINPDAIKY